MVWAARSKVRAVAKYSLPRCKIDLRLSAQLGIVVLLVLSSLFVDHLFFLVALMSLCAVPTNAT